MNLSIIKFVIFICGLTILGFTLTLKAQNILTLAGKVQYADSTGLDSIKISLFDSKGIPSNILFTDSEGNFFADSVMTNVQSKSLILPKDYKLNQNFPNQFEKKTNITYEIAAQDNTAQTETVNLKIYDILGREVKNLSSEYQGAGAYGVQWDGTNNFGKDVAEGIYFARLSIGEYSKTIKMAKVDGASNATDLTIPQPTENLTIPKTNEETFTAIIEDLKGQAKTDTAMFTLPNANIVHTLEEKLNVSSTEYNIKEGATLAIPKTNWVYTTGAAIEFQNLSAAYEMWEDTDNIYLTTVDPNANGSLGALIQTIAPHQTKNLTNLNISIDDMTNFYFQVQDLTRQDSAFTKPTILNINGTPYSSDEDGIIQGKIEPGDLVSAIASSNYAHKLHGIQVDGQALQRYGPDDPTPTIPTNQDLSGVIKMIDKNFDKAEYKVQFDDADNPGGELFLPIPNTRMGFIKANIDSLGPSDYYLAPDGKHINFYIWRAHEELPDKFKGFYDFQYDKLHPRPLPSEIEASFDDWIQNVFPVNSEHNYTSTTDRGETPPLFQSVTIYGDTVITVKPGWHILYGGDHDFHREFSWPQDNNNRTLAASSLVDISGFTINKRDREFWQPYGQTRDNDDPNAPSKLFSWGNTWSTFLIPQDWDKDAWHILWELGMGTRFWN